MDEMHLQAYIDHKNDIASLLASGAYSAADIERVSAQIQEMRAADRELYTVDESGTAHISVAGPLEPKPDPCAILFDIEMTTYSDIIEATRKAEADDMVKKITYHFSTPGGNVVGLFHTADTIRSAKKETIGIAHSLSASAGYALMSQCKIVYAENNSAEIGSIGVASEIIDFSEADKGRGIKRYVLTSSNAPDKRPDIATDEGRAKIISRLTQMESVFIDYVVSGRHVTREKVLSDFGRGGVLIAKDALQAGMIDAIISDITAAPQATDKRNATAQVNLVSEPTRSEKTGNATASNQLKESSMEITQEALDKLAADTAAKTAASVRAEMSAEFQAKETARAENDKRVAGFKPLYEKYPNQKALIDAESAKPDAYATASFAITLADAETARLAALGEQTAAATAAATATKPAGGQKPDTSGDDFLASMGVRAENLKKE
jgi:ClpP class serine protease